MYLDRIVATKKQEVEALRQEKGLAILEKEAAEAPAPRGFAEALRNRRRASVGWIAEVKKASPSKGIIRPDFDPRAIALSYERAGADCLSVLTDRDYFQGGNDVLKLVRETVPMPVLRKDFLIDELQVYEARAIGADAVLLIAAILPRKRLHALHAEAKALGMDVLVEVHDQAELETVLELGADMIGINNRNLRTFVTDLAVTEALIGRIPDRVLKVSESGIGAPDDIARVKAAGADAVLIGEHFMRQASIERAADDLLGPLPVAGERTP
jgi:indole-3-glycerol phosphate synthase